MNDIFNADCKITMTKALKQHWTQAGFSYQKKPRPDYGIMLLINGKIDFVSVSEKLSAKSGDIIFLPAGSYYEAVFRTELGDVDNYLINFKSDEKFSDFSKPELIAGDADSECFGLFKRIVEEYYSVQDREFYLKGMLYMLLDSVLNENIKSESKADKLVEKAQRLLKERYDLSVKEIAHECAVSESGLRKLFKDSTGISPIQFRMNEKINKAKYLLESTDMSVDEISDELNFFDMAYFCKTFSKYENISPGKYSKNKKL